jgi:hypothetical protein
MRRGRLGCGRLGASLVGREEGHDIFQGCVCSEVTTCLSIQITGIDSVIEGFVGGYRFHSPNRGGHRSICQVGSTIYKHLGMLVCVLSIFSLLS